MKKLLTILAGVALIGGALAAPTAVQAFSGGHGGGSHGGGGFRAGGFRGGGFRGADLRGGGFAYGYPGYGWGDGFLAGDLAYGYPYPYPDAAYVDPAYPVYGYGAAPAPAAPACGQWVWNPAAGRYDWTPGPCPPPR